MDIWYKLHLECNHANYRTIQNGRSQAVRLPKEFRFEGESEVFIARDGERIILTSKARPSIEQPIKALGKFESFPDREQSKRQQKREPF